MTASTAVLGDVRRLTPAELTAAAEQLNQEIRRRRADQLHKASLAFKVGDLVEFTDGKLGRVRFTLDRINRNTLSGVAADDKDVRYRVPTLWCRLVGSHAAPAPVTAATPGAGEF